jgi:hypothetical protein
MPGGAADHAAAFWQARYYDFNVFTEFNRIEKTLESSEARTWGAHQIL